MAEPLGWPAIIGMVGGIVGLIGGTLSLRDRFYKGRPTASLTTGVSGTQKLVTVRVKNTTDYDLIVTGATERRGVYFLAEDLNTGNILRGQLREGMFPPFMLKPGDSRELILMPKFVGGMAVEAMGDRYVEVWIYWRKGNATWLPQIPVPVCTNTRTVRNLGGFDIN